MHWFSLVNKGKTYIYTAPYGVSKTIGELTIIAESLLNKKVFEEA